MAHRLRKAIATRLDAIRIRAYVRCVRFPRRRREHYETLGRSFRPLEFRARRVMARELSSALGPAVPGIPEREGYLLWPAACNPGLVDGAIADALARLAEPDPRRATGARQALYTRVLRPQELGPDSPLLRLACNPTVVGVVARYMGHVPLLDSICLWHSPNAELLANRTSSQYFHLDPTGHREVKVFVNLHEVTPEAGPLTLVRTRRGRSTRSSDRDRAACPTSS